MRESLPTPCAGREELPITMLSVERIAHPTDFSHGSEVAFAHALKLALAAKSTLDILHVDENPREVAWEYFPHVRQTLARWNILPPRASREDVARVGVQVHKTRAKGDKPAGPVLNYLLRNPADLIVLATHQRVGFDRWLHKQVATEIAFQTEAATLFVPYGMDGFVRLQDGACSLERILLPICASPDPQPAVDAAAAIAELLGIRSARFLLLHVGNEADAPTPTTHQSLDWEWTRVNRHGNVESEILTAATSFQANLIAMTTAGKEGFLDALRGSTTEVILQKANCPVLATPAFL